MNLYFHTQWYKRHNWVSSSLDTWKVKVSLINNNNADHIFVMKRCSFFIKNVFCLFPPWSSWSVVYFCFWPIKSAEHIDQCKASSDQLRPVSFLFLASKGRLHLMHCFYVNLHLFNFELKHTTYWASRQSHLDLCLQAFCLFFHLFHFTHGCSWPGCLPTQAAGGKRNMKTKYMTNKQAHECHSDIIRRLMNLSITNSWSSIEREL